MVQGFGFETVSFSISPLTLVILHILLNSVLLPRMLEREFVEHPARHRDSFPALS